MHVPRRLLSMREPPYPPLRLKSSEIVEEGDPRGNYLLCPANHLMADMEAERLGITEYLATYDQQAKAERERLLAEAKAAAMQPPQTKAVERSEVEDKAVAGPSETKADEESERTPGVIMPPESRRQRGR